jgi:hypothetical protein
MSWDTTFDYAPTVVEIQEIVPAITARVATLQQQKNDILALSSEQQLLLQDNLNSINKEIDEENARITHYNSILSNITTLTSLSAQSKTDLHAIYTFSGEVISIYAMRQLLYHSQLLDEALPVVTNGVLSNDMKKQLVNAVFQKYNSGVTPSYYHWVPPPSTL